MSTTIGFLHTSPVHVATFDDLLRGTGVRAVHLVDPDLLERARREGPAAVADDVAGRLGELATQGAITVVCTCSTLGGLAETLAPPGATVVRVDRPAVRAAVSRGGRIGVVMALESTREPTLALVAEEAAAAGLDIHAVPVVVDGAWERFAAGEQAEYLRLVADAARRLVHHDGVDVVVLAQASMADAVALLPGLPVVATPSAAVEELLDRPPQHPRA